MLNHLILVAGHHEARTDFPARNRDRTGTVRSRLAHSARPHDCYSPNLSFSCAVSQRCTCDSYSWLSVNHEFSHHGQAWFSSALRALTADSDVPQVSAGLEPMSAVASHFQIPPPTSLGRLQLPLSREMALSVNCYI